MHHHGKANLSAAGQIGRLTHPSPQFLEENILTQIFNFLRQIKYEKFWADMKKWPLKLEIIIWKYSKEFH